ncbi:MAG: hypothetical protein Q8N15_04675, partial [Bacillota bacterium]|nr:hypothetical protein [Bacillota bacterium]
RNVRIFIMIIASTFVLIGCGLSPTTLTTSTFPTTATTTSVATTVATTTEATTATTPAIALSGDTQYVSISTLNLDAGTNDFDCEFLSLDFDVYESKVEFSFIIDDPGHGGSLYIAAAFNLDQNSKMKDYYLRTTADRALVQLDFNELKSGGRYMFLIGRPSPDQITPFQIKTQAAAGFELTIGICPTFRRIDDLEISFDLYQYPIHDDYYAERGRTSAGVDVSFDDRYDVASSVTVRFYLPDGEEPVASTTIAKEDFRTGLHDSIFVDDIIVAGLSPGVEYDVKVFISGYDGVSDFIDRFVGASSWTTENYYDKVIHSTHDLYGIVTESQITPMGLELSVRLKNEGATAAGGSDPTSFSLRIRTLEDGSVLFETPLGQTGNTTWSIPNESLRIDCRIRIESEDGTVVLFDSAINFYRPECDSATANDGTRQTIAPYWYENDGIVTGGMFEISDRVTHEVYDTIPYAEWIEYGRGTYIPIDNAPLGASLTIRYYVLFDAFGGADHGWNGNMTPPV